MFTVASLIDYTDVWEHAKLLGDDEELETIIIGYQKSQFPLFVGLYYPFINTHIGSERAPTIIILRLIHLVLLTSEILIRALGRGDDHFLGHEAWLVVAVWLMDLTLNIVHLSDNMARKRVNRCLFVFVDLTLYIEVLGLYARSVWGVLLRLRFFKFWREFGVSSIAYTVRSWETLIYGQLLDHPLRFLLLLRYWFHWIGVIVVVLDVKDLQERHILPILPNNIDRFKFRLSMLFLFTGNLNTAFSFIL